MSGILTHDIPWGQKKPPYGTRVNRKDPIGKNVVGCWLFNEGAGPNAYDASGYGNHGALQALSTGGTAWNKSGGLQFDGVSGCASVPMSVGIQSLTEITLAARVRMDSCPFPYPAIISIPISTGRLAITYQINSNRPRFNADPFFDLASPTAVVFGTYHHIAGTFDGSLATLYVDGFPILSAVVSSMGTITNNPIGVGGLPGQQYLSGAIDNIEIFNRALTPAQIYSLYANPYCYLEPRRHHVPVASPGSVRGRIINSPIINDSRIIQSARRAA